MADGRVTIDTRLDTKGAEKGMSSLKSGLGKMGKMVAIAFSVAAVTKFVSAIKNAADETKNLWQIQEQAELKLATILKQRTNATDKQIESIKKLASEQQKIGVIGDEVQLSGAQQIATFVSQTDTINTLLPAMNNLLAQQKGLNATSGDAVNIGNLMGKALMGQASALRRVGITFDANQEKIIKYGTESQKAATLAEVITSNVGEMNKALAQTDAGKAQQLANSWGDVKEQFGQAFQKIGTLFIPALAQLVMWANMVADAFVSVSKAISQAFGTSSNAVADTAGATANMTADIDTSADGMEDLADATKEAGKQANKSARAFDELVVVSNSADSSNGTSAAAGATTPSMNVDTTKAQASVNALKKILESLKTVWDDLSTKFMGGFKIGLGDWQSKVSQMKTSLNGIKDALVGIFTNEKVKGSAKNWVDSVVTAFGKMAGSITRVGMNFGVNILGGIKSYLESNSDYISTMLSDIFTANADMWNITADLSVALADISDLLTGEEAQSITSSFIEIFANSGLGILSLITKTARDLQKILFTPIIKNTNKIKTLLKTVLQNASVVFDKISEKVTEFFTLLNNTYDTSVAPFVDSLTEGLTEIFGLILDIMNDYAENSPLLQENMEYFAQVMDEDVSPALEAVTSAIGTLFDNLKDYWETTGKPVLEKMITNFLPKLLDTVQRVAKLFIVAFKSMFDAIKNLMTSLKGLIQFITGVFTGDFDKALGGIKTIYEGVWQGLIDTAKNAWEMVKSVFEITGVSTFFKNVFKAIKNVFTGENGLVAWFKEIFTNAWDSIVSVFSKGGNAFEEIETGITDVFKKVLDAIIGGINSAIKKPFDMIDSVIEEMKKLDVVGIKPFANLKKIGFKEIKVPELATGAVLPANKPFLSVVGDQKHGTNVEAPLDTIKQALYEVMANGKGNNGDIVVNIDGREVFRAVQKQSQNYFNRTGNNAFSY